MAKGRRNRASSHGGKSSSSSSSSSSRRRSSSQQQSSSLLLSAGASVFIVLVGVTVGIAITKSLQLTVHSSQHGTALEQALLLSHINIPGKHNNKNKAEEGGTRENKGRTRSSSASNTTIGKTRSQNARAVSSSGTSTTTTTTTRRRNGQEINNDQKQTTKTKDNNGNDKKDNNNNKPLNVIVLYPDDMRHDTLGCAGTQAVRTPFLDRLATAEGMRFTRNCVTTSICWISRATLFLGQYCSRHKRLWTFRPPRENQWRYSFPALLREHRNYFLGHVGKWQYRTPPEQLKAQFDYVKRYETLHWYPIKNKKNNGKNSTTDPRSDASWEHVTDRDVDSAIEFLRTRPKDRPFALQVAFYAPKDAILRDRPDPVGQEGFGWNPKASSYALYNNSNDTIRYPSNVNDSFARMPWFFHTKFEQARINWEGRFDTQRKYDWNMRQMYRMVTEVDMACERIYDELVNQGILDETMLIFTADNGFIHAEHGISGKWYPYEESIRVPLIIRDPRMPENKRGTTDDSFTLNIDLAATILGAAGLKPHKVMQGRDIADLYLLDNNNANDNKRPWRNEFFYEFPDIMAQKPAPNKRNIPFIPQSTALVRKEYKLVVYPKHNVTQLFHLAVDSAEEYDVIHDPKYAAVVNEMMTRHDQLKEMAK